MRHFYNCALHYIDLVLPKVPFLDVDMDIFCDRHFVIRDLLHREKLSGGWLGGGGGSGCPIGF